MVYLYLWDSKGWFAWCNDLEKQCPPNYPKADKPGQQFTKTKTTKPITLNRQNSKDLIEYI